MFFVPVVLISIGAQWRVGRDDTAGRAMIRRSEIVLGVIQLAGMGAAAVTGILAPSTALYLALVVSIGVGLFAVALMVARRSGADVPAAPSGDIAWQPIAREEIERMVRAIVVTFAVALAIGLVGVGVLSVTFPDAGESLQLVLPVLGLAFIASAIAAFIVGWKLLKRPQRIIGHDPVVASRIHRAVFRGGGEPLDGDELVRAVRWSAVTTVTQPLQMAGSVLNLVGLSLTQVNTLLGSGSDGVFRPIAAGLLVMFVVIIVVTVAVSVRQTRRARDFARRHAHLLAEHAPVAGGRA